MGRIFRYDGEYVQQRSRRIPQDYAEAAKWLRKAAEQGDGKAQYELASAYVNGRGVQQDFVLAYMWINLATAQGIEHARECRDLILKYLTPSQIAEAQRLARERKTKGRD